MSTQTAVTMRTTAHIHERDGRVILRLSGPMTPLHLSALRDVLRQEYRSYSNGAWSLRGMRRTREGLVPTVEALERWAAGHGIAVQWNEDEDRREGDDERGGAPGAAHSPRAVAS